jgi:type IV pilus assembly protein PilV
MKHLSQHGGAWRRRGQRGVALLEALIAILLLAIGLLGTIGLQARAYSALSEAGLRAEATLATEKLLGVMGNDQANIGDYALAAGARPNARLDAWYQETQSRIPGAAVVIVVAPAASVSGFEVDMTISWTRKAGERENVHHVVSYIASAT